MTTETDDLIRAFLADEARRAILAAPSLDEAIRRVAPRIGGRPSGDSQRLIVFLAAALLLMATISTAVAVGSGILRSPHQEPSADLGIFEPAVGLVVEGDESGIWAVDPTAGSPTRIPLTSQGGTPLGWSSDGTRLLIKHSSAHGDRLFILHADGTLTAVTEQPMVIREAAIAPDGSRVVFVEGDTDGSALYGIEAEGGDVEALVHTDNVEDVTVSPDGTWIAYVEGHGDGGHRVSLIRTDGTDAHEILANEVTVGAGHGADIAWSPAGDRIAIRIEGVTYSFAADGTGFARGIAHGQLPVWVLRFGLGNAGPWDPAAPDGNASAPTPDPSTSPAPATSAIHELPSGRGELVVNFHSWRDGYVEVAVYADGRVIWVADEQAGYLEQRLTPEGVDSLRSTVVSSGLFKRDLGLGLDLGVGNIQLRRGNRVVTVAWGPQPFNVSGLGLADRFVDATPAQAETLTNLEAFIRDPAAWGLERDMYRQSEITPFVPTHLLIGYDRSPPNLSIVPSPARETVTDLLGPAISGGCDVISIGEAQEVVDALVEVGVIDPIADVHRGFSFDLSRSFVWLDPALPHELDCSAPPAAD